MGFIRKLSTCLAVLSLLLSGSCDSLLYDDPADMPVEEKENSYAYIDCTDYKTWVYLNLSDGSQTPLAYDNTVDIPGEWTFAMHRYDCRTNGGSAYETQFTSLDGLTEAIGAGTFTIPPASAFEEDEDGKITIDMSHMMEGWLEYADSKVNNVLAKWLDVDTANMPPDYTPSDKVYLIRTVAGDVAAIRFTGYSNPQKYNTKGYISFDYIYPLENE